MAGPSDKIKSQIFEIFADAILYTSPIQKHTQELLSILHSNPEPFTHTLLLILSQCVESFKKSQKADRGMNIIVSLLKDFRQTVCSYESEHKSQVAKDIVFDLVDFLCSELKTTSTNKREGLVWLLEKILSLNIHQLMEFSQDLYEKIEEILPSVVKDKNKNIRNYGISIASGLNRVGSVLEFMAEDPTVQNRKNLVKVTVDVQEIAKVVESLNDVDSEVRLAAYEKVASWGFEALSNEYRREVFLASAFDRCARVKKVAGEIIQAQVQVQGLETVVRMLGIEQLHPLKQKEVRKTVTELLKMREIEEVVRVVKELVGKIVSFKADFAVLALAPIAVKVLYRERPQMVCDLLPSQKLIQMITLPSSVFPCFYCQTLIHLCVYLDIGAEETRRAFLNQLLEVCKSFPVVHSPASISRKYFNTYNDNVFAEDSVELFRFTSKIIKKLVDKNPNEYLRIMTEVVNEIREPLMILEKEEDSGLFIENTQKPTSLLEKKMGYHSKISDLEAELEELHSQKSKLVMSNMIQEALKIHFEVDRVENELDLYSKKLQELEEELNKVLIRALVLTCDMLIRTKNGRMHSDIPDLVSTLVQPGLESEAGPIVELATECLAQCCVHNMEMLVEYNEYFNCLLVDKKSGNTIRQAVISFYLDLMLVRDPKSLNKTLKFKEKNSVLWSISHFFYSPNLYLRAFAVEGLCKVFLAGKIKSSSLLATLLIPYFDGTSPSLINQSLQFIFPHFSIVSERNPRILCNAFKTLIFFLFCLATSQEFLDIKFSFTIKKMFHFVCTSLSTEYIQRHGSFEPKSNYSLEIFYHICQTVFKISKSDSKSDLKIHLKPEILIRFLPYINISRFTDKELFICYKMMKNLTIDETLIEFKILKKIMDSIAKKNLGYIICEDLDNHLIDCFIKSENSAQKFFSRVNSEDPEYIAALSHIKSVFQLYTGLKTNPTSRMCSELKRSKNI